MLFKCGVDPPSIAGEGEMPSYKQVVLATDLSTASIAAVPVAIGLAKIFKAEVIILNVFQYVPHHRYQVPVGWMVDIIRKDVQAQLGRIKHTIDQADIKSEIVVIDDGVAFQQILEFVDACESCILVMGTHAISGLDRFFLGSTAEDVLRSAHCPVVTVGPQVTTSTDDRSRFERVLFATDFSEVSLAALPLALTLQRSELSSLRVIHVSEEAHADQAAEYRRFDLIRNAVGSDPLESRDCLEEYAILRGIDVSREIVHEAERYQADLIILGVRRASAFVSHQSPKIAFQVIAASPCAVLTVSI
jgi:nucleotide-binding universal stress UspA family protein